MRQKHSIEAPNQVVATDTSGHEKSRVLLLTCLGVTPAFQRQNSPRDLHFRPNDEKKKMDNLQIIHYLELASEAAR